MQYMETVIFFVVASPPKFVSLTEVMKAAHGIGNMVLAHEIAVDGDVQLQRNEPSPDRLEYFQTLIYTTFKHLFLSSNVLMHTSLSGI